MPASYLLRSVRSKVQGHEGSDVPVAAYMCTSLGLGMIQQLDLASVQYITRKQGGVIDNTCRKKVYSFMRNAWLRPWRVTNHSTGIR